MSWKVKFQFTFFRFDISYVFPLLLWANDALSTSVRLVMVMIGVSSVFPNPTKTFLGTEKRIYGLDGWRPLASQKPGLVTITTTVLATAYALNTWRSSWLCPEARRDSGAYKMPCSSKSHSRLQDWKESCWKGKSDYPSHWRVIDLPSRPLFIQWFCTHIYLAQAFF